MMESDIDISQELKSKNYENIINYIDQKQENLLRLWLTVDSRALEHMILMLDNTINFWEDSIKHNRLWMALIKYGELIGTLNVIKRMMYEKDMDSWLQNRIPNDILSNKECIKIIQLLEINGVMDISEIINKPDECNDSDIITAVNVISNLQLINVANIGKCNLCSLTDSGIRYARILSKI